MTSAFAWTERSDDLDVDASQASLQDPNGELARGRSIAG